MERENRPRVFLFYLISDCKYEWKTGIFYLSVSGNLKNTQRRSIQREFQEFWLSPLAMGWAFCSPGIPLHSHPQFNCHFNFGVQFLSFPCKPFPSMAAPFSYRCAVKMNQRTFVFLNKMLWKAFISKRGKFGFSSLWKLESRSCCRGRWEINSCSPKVKYDVMRSCLSAPLPTFPQ